MSDDILQELTGVVLTFTKEMNDMETIIRDNSLQDEEKQTNWFAEFEQQYLSIMDKYCTNRKRVYKRSSYSLGEPYYHGISAANEIALNQTDEKKAQLTFCFDSHNMGKVQYKFSLFSKKDGWRIDSVKRWSNWKKKWVDHIL